MKRNFLWMVWGIASLILVLLLGTKSFVAEAALTESGKERTTVIVTPEQYKTIKFLNFSNFH